MQFGHVHIQSPLQSPPSQSISTHLIIVADGVRIWEIFSRKSSLNDLALRAIFVPRKLPLWPDGDGVAAAAPPATPDEDDDTDDVLTTAPG